MGHPYHPYRPVPAPPAVTPAGQPLASFGDRFLAHLIDVAIFFGVTLVIWVPTFILFFMSFAPEITADPAGPDTFGTFFRGYLLPFLLLQLGLMAVSMLLAYVYYVEMMFRSGTTVGKRVMKLRVVPLDPEETLGRGHAFRRYLIQFVGASLLPGLSYLDGLWQLWDKPYQQCLHDKFARTAVVKVPA